MFNRDTKGRYPAKTLKAESCRHIGNGALQLLVFIDGNMCTDFFLTED